MNLINRVKAILLSPKTEWLVIATENQTLASLITSYVIPLSLVSAAATFIGYSFVWELASINWGIYHTVIILVGSILSAVVSSYVIDALAPSFGSEKNLNRSAQLVVYSSTPSLIGGILNIFPPLAIIGSLLGLYGLYIWYLGLGPIKKTPEDKRVGYLVVSIIVLIVVYIVIWYVLGLILLGALGLSAVAPLSPGV
jgi:hypothetical protein